MRTRGLLKDAAILAFWIFLGAASSVLLNNFVLVNAMVLTGSMEGTIAAENRVFGLRSGFTTAAPRRGDIIVFESPLPAEFSEPFIKRVIGLPGEEVAVTDGVVLINGTQLRESYVSEAMRRDFAAVTVPEGQFFVMGDNRNFSRDSREWGPICGESIIGRIYLGFGPGPTIIANYIYETQ